MRDYKNNNFLLDIAEEQIKGLPTSMSKSEKMKKINSELYMTSDKEVIKPYDDEIIFQLSLAEKINVTEREVDISIILTKMDSFRMILKLIRTGRTNLICHQDIVSLTEFIVLLKKYDIHIDFLEMSVDDYNNLLKKKGHLDSSTKLTND